MFYQQQLRFQHGTYGIGLNEVRQEIVYDQRYMQGESHSAQALQNTPGLIGDKYIDSSHAECWMDDYLHEDEPQDNGWMEDLD